MAAAFDREEISTVQWTDGLGRRRGESRIVSVRSRYPPAPRGPRPGGAQISFRSDDGMKKAAVAAEEEVADEEMEREEIAEEIVEQMVEQMVEEMVKQMVEQMVEEIEHEMVEQMVKEG